ncbi:hypothetical protein LQ327_32230 [Actinomycetospora endophytica]|uniref:DUF4878 domain-containing protein n=1 Tax=Actinomycetospora endophytica TaxID=2291215 RepID=A0ABS8PKN4_9PSEU|nr:hypothetical protein [Actinomycetospora endophytica]MCD2198050.1 hypothetical protein [Actinomycetospora endophytica]
MTEGRTSAAEANVDAEDRPVDESASTGATGAGDATGSAGTNGHDAAGDGTTSSAADDTASADEKAKSDDTTESSDSGKSDAESAAETVPAAKLPGEESGSAPAHGAAADTKAEDKKAEDKKAEDKKADATTAATKTDAPATDDAATGDEEWAEAEDKAYKKELRKGFMFGAAGGIVIGAIVALLLGAFVWPGYLMGPGNPDDTANQVTQALAAKDGPKLDELSCKGPDGKPVAQLSGQVLQYIAKVQPAGPATTLIDTEARAPVDLTLTVQGQTQTLPSELVLGESKGDWCLKGLAQRQQQ